MARTPKIHFRTMEESTKPYCRAGARWPSAVIHSTADPFSDKITCKTCKVIARRRVSGIHREK